MDPTAIARRTFLQATSLATLAFLHPNLRANERETAGRSKSQRPRCDRIPGSKYQIGGVVSKYLTGVTEQWLKITPYSNPAILEMFRDRDRLPLRDLVPWAGEFAGKYLTSAVTVLRLVNDAELREEVSRFVSRLVELQAEDGYLGPWPRPHRLTGRAPNVGASGGDTWDAWGHYHLMLGLLLWHEQSQDPRALECARRIGDLFCRRFEQARLVDTGSTEMNLAPIHSLCLLHSRTGEPRYLQLALRISEEFAARDAGGKPLAGDYLEAALRGDEFYQMPRPRWESLHPIMGMAELFWITGDERYRRAFEHIWWSIVRLDRHNNGGFSSGEQAQGNPYHPGAIETCCTIAWMALSVEMLRMTGDSIVADELELSTCNSVVGLHSPTGRWVTYNTPMDGTRKASAHDIVFQARAGSPELNCCSVNGARGFGMISDWAVMTGDDALILNWYGPSIFVTRVPGGPDVTLRQETDYPRGNKIRLTLELARPATFALKLRIPYWSPKTRVWVNQDEIPDVSSGSYLTLDRSWKPNDSVELTLDFSLHYWVGERECAGKVSIYCGPILLTFDRRFNTMDPADLPVLHAPALTGSLVEAPEWLAPLLLMELPAENKKAVRLCDFGSAGMGGSPYLSWLKVTGVSPSPFTRKNPLRSGRF